MNCTHKLVLIAGLSIMSLSRPAVAGEIRTWKSQSGESVEAAFLSESLGVVTLQTADGKRIQIRRATLVPQDEAYLKRVLHKPTTNTISLAPNTALGYLIYTPTKEPENTSGRQSIDWRKRDTNKSERRELAHQTDTICFRVQSSLDGKWMDDSTWNVLRAENLGQQISGNTDHPDERKGSDGIFLRVVFRVVNTGKKERQVVIPTILDAKEREFTMIDESRKFIPKDVVDPSVDNLRPGFSRTYCAIYEIPKEAAGLRLKVFTLDSYDFRDQGTDLPMGCSMIALDVENVE